MPLFLKQNRENTAECSSLKVEKRHGKFAKTGINNWSKASPEIGTDQGVRKGKRSLLAYQTHCKWSKETSRNSVKAKLRIKVIKLDQNMIG